MKSQHFPLQFIIFTQNTFIFKLIECIVFQVPDFFALLWLLLTFPLFVPLVLLVLPLPLPPPPPLPPLSFALLIKMDKKKKSNEMKQKLLLFLFVFKMINGRAIDWTELINVTSSTAVSLCIGVHFLLRKIENEAKSIAYGEMVSIKFS